MNPTAVEGRFERTFKATGPVNLDIATDSGVIRVTAGLSESVEVRGILRARESLFSWGDAEGRVHELETNPPVEQRGDTIRVGYLAGNWLTGGVVLLLDITAPPEAAVQFRTDSGDFRVEGIQGRIGCHTDSGRIEITNAGAGVRAESDSGPIQIQRVNGPVYVESDSGQIHALEVGGAIEARTDSGEIQLQLAGGSGYNLRVRTDRGSIRTPDTTGGERSATGVIGQIRGGGPLVELETDSGNIEVE